MRTVLVVEDDDILRDTLGVILEREHFLPIGVSNGHSGFERALTLKPDLLLMDLKLPGLGGVEVCKQIRAAGMRTPIIVLSALGDEIDKVLLLEIGADDYIVKPFGTRELLARIKALLRRTSIEGSMLHFGEVEVDLERRLITFRGKEVMLTPSEYKLLLFFLHNCDQPLTRDLILNSVWGSEAYPNSRTVDAHVLRLRHKLEPDPNIPRHLLTVHGIGYRFSL